MKEPFREMCILREIKDQFQNNHKITRKTCMTEFTGGPGMPYTYVIIV